MEAAIQSDLVHNAPICVQFYSQSLIITANVFEAPVYKFDSCIDPQKNATLSQVFLVKCFDLFTALFILLVFLLRISNQLHKHKISLNSNRN